MVISITTVGSRKKKVRTIKQLAGGHDLPEELMEDILSRLDAEEVCSGKLVSKGFLSLLSSKSFMAKHLKQMVSLNRSIFLFQEEFVYSPLFYHADGVANMINGRLVTDEDKDLEILASSGALCLYCNFFDEFYLLNPTTYEKRVLPTCKINYPLGCTWAQVIFGMGYDDEADDYKVVRVALFNSIDFKSEVMVYSWNAGFWSHGVDFLSDYPTCQHGVYVCGRLHWRSSIFFKKYSITSYNIRDGSYDRFEMPEVPLLYGVQQIVSLDDQTLAVSCSSLRNDEDHTVWILEDYNDKESWLKVSIKLTWPVFENKKVTLQPLCLVNPHRIEILARVDPIGCFIMYNIMKKDYKIIRAEETVKGSMTTYRFVSSFHSPYPKVR